MENINKLSKFMSEGNGKWSIYTYERSILVNK